MLEKILEKIDLITWCALVALILGIIIQGIYVLAK